MFIFEPSCLAKSEYSRNASQDVRAPASAPGWLFPRLKQTGKRSQSTLLVGLLSLAFPPALGLLWGPVSPGS